MPVSSYAKSLINDLMDRVYALTERNEELLEQILQAEKRELEALRERDKLSAELTGPGWEDYFYELVSPFRSIELTRKEADQIIRVIEQRVRR